MSIRKLLPLLVALLFAALSGRAQGRREVDTPITGPRHREVRVSVTLPKAVSIIRDYGKILLSRNADKDKLQRLTNQLRVKTDKPVVDITVEIPKNWVTRKLGLTE